MVLTGHPGKLRLSVRDAAGPEAQPMLKGDTMDLNMKPGPATKLAIEGGAVIEAGTKAVLPRVCVHAVDSGGNPTQDGGFEV